VNIEIKPFEPLDIDLEGFHGKGCSGIADLLAELGKAVEREQKPEYKQVRIGQKAGTRTRIGRR
jgi:hypothetical protein